MDVVDSAIDVFFEVWRVPKVLRSLPVVGFARSTYLEFSSRRTAGVGNIVC